MFYPVDALCREHLYKARTGDTDFEDILYEFHSVSAPHYFFLRAGRFGCTKYMIFVGVQQVIYLKAKSSTSIQAGIDKTVLYFCF